MLIGFVVAKAIKITLSFHRFMNWLTVVSTVWWFFAGLCFCSGLHLFADLVTWGGPLQCSHSHCWWLDGYVACCFALHVCWLPLFVCTTVLRNFNCMPLAVSCSPHLLCLPVQESSPSLHGREPGGWTNSGFTLWFVLFEKYNCLPWSTCQGRHMCRSPGDFALTMPVYLSWSFWLVQV